ncbi:hypothetical protein [Halovivax sp.]|uniref:hypothetical protein n=1 Tax=Halovivax sp. TaxID=1935978 RepID=UPI0025BCA05F|nr:hypothetical protein [Halovivax sp.]
MTIAYCKVCAWSLETGDGTTRDDVNRAMIDHHVETGHAPIETTDAAAFGPADGRDRPPETTEGRDRPSERTDGSNRPSTGRGGWTRK